MNYTIITENDISQWEDDTGTLYHFPSKYLKLLRSGTKVIYYKGRIKDKAFEKARLSNEPHYFGIAEIGRVYNDTTNLKNYFAEIENYSPFNKPVSFKDPNGNYLEEIPETKKSNYWRDGVRSSSKDIFEKILSLSSFVIPLENPVKVMTPVIYPNLADQTAGLTEEELLKFHEEKNQVVYDSSSRSSFSKNSKKIGDIGERLVIEFLKYNSEYIEESIKWHANEGETPGYDISCKTTKGEFLRLEVKSTTGKKFSNFIMTENEIKAAKEYKKEFKIVLVADCLSQKPKINIIENPVLNSNFKFEALSYKVTQFK